MAPAPAPSQRQSQSQYENFLFATISEDRNGLCVSALSALARLDFDPWDEAAELDQLAIPAATERLRSLIVRMPEDLSTQHDAGATAARLVALLPHGGPAQLLLDRDRQQSTASVHSQALLRIVVLNAIVIALILGAPYVTATNEPAVRNGAVDAATATAVSTLAKPASPSVTAGRTASREPDSASGDPASQSARGQPPR